MEPNTEAIKEHGASMTWLVVICTISAFGYAFGIGANDVANSFASTVASKSLSLKQAIIVASIFEFLGATLLGAGVTSTIRGKIFEPQLYADEPDLVSVGLTTSTIIGTIILLLATRMTIPISTTHTMVGCIMGFSISAKGFDSINWEKVQQIFLSWIISPVATAAIALVFFSSIRYFSLRHTDSFDRAYFTFPLILGVGMCINQFFIIYKGFNNFAWAQNMSIASAMTTSVAFGALCGILWLYPIGGFIVATIKQRKKAREEAAAKANSNVDETAIVDNSVDRDNDENESADDLTTDTPDVQNDVPETENDTVKKKTFLDRLADMTYKQDLHLQSMDEDKKAKSLWGQLEDYDEDTEQLFTFLQVFTSCLNAFAHGANDVANAVGPVSGVLLLYRTHAISQEAIVPKWILAYGGLGIALGCVLYGYNVMKSLGFKVVALSPSRGASAQLSASLFVVTAAVLGIPVSTTQSITGAILGVGLASGFKQVNWCFFVKVCIGWVFAFLLAVILSSVVFLIVALSMHLI